MCWATFEPVPMDTPNSRKEISLPASPYRYKTRGIWRGPGAAEEHEGVSMLDSKLDTTFRSTETGAKDSRNKYECTLGSWLCRFWPSRYAGMRKHSESVRKAGFGPKNGPRKTQGRNTVLDRLGTVKKDSRVVLVPACINGERQCRFSDLIRRSIRNT